MFFIDLLMILISMLFLIIGVLVGVAFLTLLERKVLGYIQIRKGPNKVGFLGILQPFSDAIKLFTKEQTYPLVSNFIFYYISPVFNLFLALLMWMCIPFFSYFFNFNFGLLFFLCCSSLGVYTIMISGWSSNSNYSLLGGIRSVAQTISYEVSLALILLSFLFLTKSFSMFSFCEFQENIWFLFLCFPLCLMWLVSGLAETNRTPFDFAEGESELVSGFNVEYSSGGFALIFLAEYSNILFMSMMSCLLFLGGDFYSFMFFIKLVFISFFWIWARGTLPRFRYDKLMYLAWKSYLPVSLNYLMFFSGLSFFIFSLII
uniref:NADH-ubiquinone oxidoreductase chain 1 n=1 Tax=Dermestes ater TaxID=1546019 RepID=A0A7S6ZPT2_9COLE|nr:NADH dehydrogenase subunit 1 [Dermestes ater]QOW08056.1 NADH dehydrogenase subunit 1 [Dermestes ater]QTC31960.1 NADH dehydrogenase subunit 1 [Dermestes ater]